MHVRAAVGSSLNDYRSSQLGWRAGRCGVPPWRWCPVRRFETRTRGLRPRNGGGCACYPTTLATRLPSVSPRCACGPLPPPAEGVPETIQQDPVSAGAEAIRQHPVVKPAAIQQEPVVQPAAQDRARTRAVAPWPMMAERPARPRAAPRGRQALARTVSAEAKVAKVAKVREWSAAARTKRQGPPAPRAVTSATVTEPVSRAPLASGS